MKKSLLFRGLILLAVCPAYLYAQEIQLPEVVIKANRDLVPAKVKSAFIEEFGAGHLPVEWVSSNTKFRITSGIQNIDPVNTDIVFYSFYIRTDNDWTLDANYTPEGKLISSREYLKDFKPKRNVVLAVKNSDFRDWHIKSDFLIINTLPSGASKERYGLIVQKGNKKKTLYFDKKGKMLTNSNRELANTN
jgi:hypothetical protein